MRGSGLNRRAQRQGGSFHEVSRPEAGLKVRRKPLGTGVKNAPRQDRQTTNNDGLPPLMIET
jgi:hypothetical protein